MAQKLIIWWSSRGMHAYDTAYDVEQERHSVKRCCDAHPDAHKVLAAITGKVRPQDLVAP